MPWHQVGTLPLLVCLSLYLSSQGRQPRSGSARKLESDAVHLMLNEEQGFYEIGPQLEDNNIFVLSVTIGLASNLAKVKLFIK